MIKLIENLSIIIPSLKLQTPQKKKELKKKKLYDKERKGERK